MSVRNRSSTKSLLAKSGERSATHSDLDTSLAWPLCLDDRISFFTLVLLNIEGVFGSGKQNKFRFIGSHAKLDFLKHICSKQAPPDILCFTETKLSARIDSSEVELPGFSLHRRNRVGKGSGGIAIYTQHSLDASPFDLTSSPCSRFECATVKVTSRLKTYLFAYIYCLPSSSAS